MDVETAIASLLWLSDAKSILANIRDFTEVMEIRDRAVALQAYANARGADEAANLALEVKLRAERRAGEFLREMKNEGIIVAHRPRNNSVKLAELNVGETESRRWQLMASLPEAEFEELVLDVQTRTQSAILRAARESIEDKSGEPFQYELYNVWKVFPLDESFGRDYPGRTPHQILMNLLYYCTEEGDLVVDPMAGGGTTIDVCREMNRECQAYDLVPSRPDIMQNDVLKEIPCKNSNFIFLDPPYYNLMGEYVRNEWNESYQSFLTCLEKTLSNAKDALKEGGRVALLLKPMNERMLDGEWLDMTFDSVMIAKRLGYRLMKRISVPLSTQQFSAHDVSRAKEMKAMLNTLRDLIILEKSV